jgi:hypothetical protein
MMRTYNGFTVVELLVIVSIIVLLLALLAPALDKAIYRAELALCGTHLKGVATGVMTYAMENKRWYPYRAGVHYPSPTAFYTPISLVHGEDNVMKDDRPLLRPYFSINGMLNDPLAPRVDLDNTHPESWVWAPYAMWFGFQFKHHSTNPTTSMVKADGGMFRMGDRLEFTNRGNQPAGRFRVLAQDLFYTRSTDIDIASSHPDPEGLLRPVAQQDQDGPAQARAQYADPDGRHTYSRWEVSNTNRVTGPMDLNFAFDDGGVALLGAIAYDETERVDRVALTSRSTSFPSDWAMIAR